ncbi:HU family DNA-binding protein [Isoptericola halotolerans]|uniref:HU family DNA-binding protein n=1 Tax=Isoptericola halotolerans TaxID=300560 RepID=UPI00388E82FE
MNKAELVAAVAERADSSPTEARKHVDAVLESIVDGVAGGERVSLVGFGTFDSTSRAARTARNPRTGASVEVPAAVVPRFRIGTAFKAKVAAADGPTAARTPGTARRPVPTATDEAPTVQSTKVAQAADDGTASGGKKKTSKKDAGKGSKGSPKNGSKKDKKKSKKGKKPKKK